MAIQGPRHAQLSRAQEQRHASAKFDELASVLPEREVGPEASRGTSRDSRDIGPVA